MLCIQQGKTVFGLVLHSFYYFRKEPFPHKSLWNILSILGPFLPFYWRVYCTESPAGGQAGQSPDAETGLALSCQYAYRQCTNGKEIIYSSVHLSELWWIVVTSFVVKLFSWDYVKCKILQYWVLWVMVISLFTFFFS